MTPIGRHVVVRLLPEPPRSTIIHMDHLTPDAMNRRATVVSVGSTCRNVKPGETVVVRLAVGVAIDADGGLYLVPEVACVATIPTVTV